MKRLLTISLLIVAIAITNGCDRDRAIAPESESSHETTGPEAVAERLVAEAGWPGTGQDVMRDVPHTIADVEGMSNEIFNLNREVLTGDVVHYSFEIRVGSGEFDVIGMHRVVKERRPYRPIRTRESIFMIHGSSGTFVDGFLLPNTPYEISPAVYLASNDIDVWGIDLGWSLVPEETTDFSFMAEWGIQKDLDHLGIGLLTARFTRLLTGSGWRKMDVLGHSLGATLVYALANAETQVPRRCRQVKGIIPVDIIFKTDVEEIREARCEAAAEALEDVENGIYANDYLLIHLLGNLAQSAPDDPSPVIDGMTNLQAALFIGTNTYVFTPWHPTYHMVAGVFDENGLPAGLQYSQINAWLQKCVNFGFYIPRFLQYELNAIACDEVDLPYDDHLGEIVLPTLYLGAAGGMAEYGLYTPTLLGSSDVTTILIQLRPPEESLLDFGHTDFFLADNAVSLVYVPILDWMESH